MLVDIHLKLVNDQSLCVGQKCTEEKLKESVLWEGHYLAVQA